MDPDQICNTATQHFGLLDNKSQLISSLWDEMRKWGTSKFWLSKFTIFVNKSDSHYSTRYCCLVWQIWLQLLLKWLTYAWLNCAKFSFCWSQQNLSGSYSAVWRSIRVKIVSETWPVTHYILTENHFFRSNGGKVFDTKIFTIAVSPLSTKILKILI